jgi:nitrate reductase gamma subunit
MAIFVLGHIWRWRYDRYGWTSYSTQLQERRRLKVGAPLFHYGTFAAIFGHILGILIPKSAIDAIGIPDHAYHLFSATAGLLAAALVIIGVVILASRRLFVPRYARPPARSTASNPLAAGLLIVAVSPVGSVPKPGSRPVSKLFAYRCQPLLRPRWRLRSRIGFLRADGLDGIAFLPLFVAEARHTSLPTETRDHCLRDCMPP